MIPIILETLPLDWILNIRQYFNLNIFTVKFKMLWVHSLDLKKKKTPPEASYNLKLLKQKQNKIANDFQNLGASELQIKKYGLI